MLRKGGNMEVAMCLHNVRSTKLCSTMGWSSLSACSALGEHLRSEHAVDVGHLDNGVERQLRLSDQTRRVGNCRATDRRMVNVTKQAIILMDDFWKRSDTIWTFSSVVRHLLVDEEERSQSQFVLKYNPSSY
ncbi:hypothetical protein M514_11885 [Trichuris suis]|uniref:Uncharacterized protein n=1 Tax=Trichuris suis TaxID=68888 RepID=A0A085N191_9BILA|nr:hypothetical protein M514_11885 [Trichuris suis]